MNIVITSRGDYWVSERIFRKVYEDTKDFVFKDERFICVPRKTFITAFNVRSKCALETTLKFTKPTHVFFLFWSWKIPSHIIKKYNCISFHEADLPKFRGGSPIQNQIAAGLKKTKITAFKTTDELDAGDVLLKRDLSLEGDLDDIWKRISVIIPEMIREIIRENPKPIPQKGKPTYYKRRTPEQSEIKPSEMTVEEAYNLVRMLNVKPYPHAFIKCKDGRLLITKAEIGD